MGAFWGIYGPHFRPWVSYGLTALGRCVAKAALLNSIVSPAGTGRQRKGGFWKQNSKTDPGAATPIGRITLEVIS